MTTVRGTIRSTNTITADGHADDQSTALAAYLQSIPEGWISLGITVDA
ncbi:hypothetical protein NY542_00080 [Curtobacterium flaccumfaciens pv. betae]|nr:hypothetical protein [Curtobacterium flaccumfaciens]MBT1608499.1 hypothetical protein [Curtobacterium flaccumfaciens pv. betae]MBT1657456.1 hypothetical protein [Curtobacterium flaccumfaciens pv. betae]MCS5465599.1 hypothetical protein [Curtobacterium flaccumfaciens pv. betae]MCX2873660.1 hypothetical protein [Curtobacterium flaccumfaciens pv. betae]